jgi:antitoxin YefM
MKRFLYEGDAKGFDRLWEAVAEARRPVVVSRKGAKPLVMMPLSAWRSVHETLHLFRSPTNGLRLLSALQRAEAGAVFARGL